MQEFALVEEIHVVVEQAAEQQALDTLCVNTIRILSADGVQQANSGHPGMPMGAAPMAYALWSRYLKHNPQDPKWADRDRFVLSAGHGSMLLYSLLYLTGYDLPLDELKRFRQWGSKTPGHPESSLTAGVEVATGPLGQGFSMGVGMAIAERWLAARFNRPGHTIVDHYTYVICSDGDLMEGVASEAASLAGHLALGKMIYLYDQNYISLAGQTNLSYTEDVAKRFDSYGWHTVQVQDGNDVEEISRAIEAARAETGKPSLILVHTQIGFGSPKKQNTYHVHGSPLGEEELQATKKALGWPTMDKFYVPEEASVHMREAVTKGQQSQEAWRQGWQAYQQAFPEEASQYEHFLSGDMPANLEQSLPQWKPGDKPVATRVSAGQALNALAKVVPNIIGGSADLNPSTNTALKGEGDFQPDTADRGTGDTGAVGSAWGYAGRNLHFGVREHAMGAAVNGMAAHGGVFPFSATFMTFSDYMKPAVRLGALMELRVVYVFTHDSIGLGEDGPTHQPVEQLAGLRAIPNLSVIRPADATESAEAWAVALRHHGPTVLVLSRQNLPILDRSGAQDASVSRGAYILADADNAQPDVILIGTGSEVSLCVLAREELQKKGVQARVVSMPSWDLFDKQDAAYREQVLPKSIAKRVAVETASPMGWERYAGTEGRIVAVHGFGASAPLETILEHYGFTAGAVAEAALALLGRGGESGVGGEASGSGEVSAEPTAPTEGHS